MCDILKTVVASSKFDWRKKRMCNLFIQIYSDKPSEKPSEKVKPVFTTTLSDVGFECLTISCNGNNIVGVQNKNV